MIRLRTHAQVYSLYLFRLGIAMDKFHEAKKKFEKGSLIRHWRYRLVFRAGKRVSDYEKLHPELLEQDADGKANSIEQRSRKRPRKHGSGVPGCS